MNKVQGFKIKVDRIDSFVMTPVSKKRQLGVDEL